MDYNSITTFENITNGIYKQNTEVKGRHSINIQATLRSVTKKLRSQSVAFVSAFSTAAVL